MTDYSEKRDYIRMAAECEISFTDPDSGLRHHGLSKNLSGRGVLFDTSKELKPGSLIDLTVSPENAPSAAFDAVVEIIRVTPTADKKIFCVAAKIKEIIS